MISKNWVNEFPFFKLKITNLRLTSSWTLIQSSILSVTKMSRLFRIWKRIYRSCLIMKHITSSSSRYFVSSEKKKQKRKNILIEKRSNALHFFISFYSSDFLACTIIRDKKKRLEKESHENWKVFPFSEIIVDRWFGVRSFWNNNIIFSSIPHDFSRVPTYFTIFSYMCTHFEGPSSKAEWGKVKDRQEQ